MNRRGRKSAVELSIIPAESTFKLKPPADLSPEQAAEFTSIVNRFPNVWFGSESAGLLSAYCRHSSNARLIAAEIEGFKAEWLRSDKGIDRFDRLSKILEREHKAMSSLAAKMRLTQSSRSKPGPAATMLANNTAAGEARPWDYYSETEEAEVAQG